MNFVDDHEIDFVHLGIDTKRQSWNSLSEEAVLAALDILLNPANYPVMVMCYLGRHRTGAPRVEASVCPRVMHARSWCTCWPCCRHRGGLPEEGAALESDVHL